MKCEMDETTGSLTDRILSTVETVTVVLLALGVYSVVIYELWWIWFGAEAGTRASRLEVVAKMLNENWKAELLLLIPLFYRTIRGFLERVEEFAGMKAPRPPLKVRPAVPNPHQEERPPQDTQES